MAGRRYEEAMRDARQRGLTGVEAVASDAYFEVEMVEEEYKELRTLEAVGKSPEVRSSGA